MDLSYMYICTESTCPYTITLHTRILSSCIWCDSIHIYVVQVHSYAHTSIWEYVSTFVPYLMGQLHHDTLVYVYTYHFYKHLLLLIYAFQPRGRLWNNSSPDAVCKDSNHTHWHLHASPSLCIVLVHDQTSATGFSSAVSLKTKRIERSF